MKICVLDEPSNFLDREALGGLAVAIKEWAGAVVIISHNDQFVSSLCTSLCPPPFFFECSGDANICYSLYQALRYGMLTTGG